MIINPQSLGALFTTYDTRWTAQYAAFKPQSFYQRLAMTMPSNSSMTVYSWLAHLPRMREWLGPRMIRNISGHQTALKNKKYELTLEIQREVLEDDQYDQYGIWMDQAAASTAKWPDQQVIPLLLSGNTGALGTGFDGQNFFDTAHPVDGIAGSTGSGTQSNYYTGTALNPYNYGVVRAQMMMVNGEDNQSLSLNPRLLVVPPQLEAMAKTIVGSQTFGAGILDNTSGAAPVLNPYAGTATVLVIPELAAQPTAWYLLDDSQPVKPLIWQIRKEPEFTYRNQLTDEHVFSVDAFLYGIRARGAAGYGLWFLAAKAVG